MMIAESLGGTERKFARTMTRKARALGMARTSFRNASGLPNRRQLSTARDVATLAIALKRDFPRRYGTFATKDFRFRGKTYRNHNGLLDGYPGTDGLKTGYIRASGYNVAASVERRGRRLVGVVLGAKSPKSRNRHMIGLFDRSFQRLEKENPGARPAAAVWSVSGSPPPRQTGAVAARAWSIQVGAYLRQGPARRAASRARQGAPSLLAPTRTVITIATARGRSLFRARLTGLSRGQARQACVLLKARKLACMAVSPRAMTTLAKAS